MQHVLTPYSPAIQPYVWWENAFNEKELDWLQTNAIESKERAQVGGNPNEDDLKKIRRSQISWINKNNDTAWVFEKLGNVVSILNAQYFRFDLTGFGENLQLTNYDQSEQGMYGWHVDHLHNSNGPNRKLSVVLQLTDPSQYDGGNLQLNAQGSPITIKKQRGLIVAFPSYTLHQVTPVTSGSRQSLVAWITGPAYK